MPKRPFQFPREVQRLFKRRIVLVGHPIDDFISQMTTASLLYLSFDDALEPILLIVKSPGGLVSPSLAVADVIRKSNTPIHTHCWEKAHGMAALLVAAGAKGFRTCSKDGTLGMASSSEKKVADEFARVTGAGVEGIQADMARERRFSADEAIAYGLIDHIRQDIPDLE